MAKIKLVPYANLRSDSHARKQTLQPPSGVAAYFALNYFLLEVIFILVIYIYIALPGQLIQSPLNVTITQWCILFQHEFKGQTPGFLN